MMQIRKIAHLTGHSGAIYCLAHYKERFFFSGGFDNLVVQWNIDTPDTAKAIAKLNSKAISLLYLKEKNWLFAGQSTGGVHVIDLETGKEIHLLQAHVGMVFSLCYDFVDNKLFVGAEDGRISAWNLNTMECRSIEQLAYGKIRDIRLHNGFLYVGSESGSVVILTKQFREVGLVSEHQKGYSVYTMNIDGDRLITGSRDGHLNVIKQTGSNFDLVKKIPAHNFAIYKIAKSPDGNFFGTASRDKSIKIWDSNNVHFIKKIDFQGLKGHTGSVNDLLWIDNYIISVSDDRSVIVWEVSNGVI